MMRRKTHEEIMKEINDLTEQDSTLRHLSKSLEFTSNIDKLRVVSATHAEYVDLDERLKVYDALGREISETDLPHYYKRDLFKEIKEQKDTILSYKLELCKTEVYKFAIV